MNEKKWNDKEVKTEVDRVKENYSEAEIRDLIKGFGSDFLSPMEKIRILYLDVEIDDLESFQSLSRRVCIYCFDTRKRTRDYW